MSDIKIKVDLDGEQSLLTISQINQKISELSDQSNNLEKTSEELNKIILQIESLKKALSENIKIDVDTSIVDKKIGSINTDLQEIKDNSVINLDVNADKAKIDSILNDLNSGNGVNIPVNLDANDAINKLNQDTSNLYSQVNIDVNVNDEEANQKIDVINQETELLNTNPVDIKVNADTSEASNSLNVVNSETDNLNNTPVDIKVNADTSEATAKLDAINQDNLNDVNIDVNVNDEQAISQLDTINTETNSLNDTPVDIKVNADTSQADASLKDLNSEVKSVDDKPIKLDVNADKAQIDDLIKSLKDGKKVGEDLGKTDVTPKLKPEEVINQVTKTTNSVAALRKQLIDLTAQFENTEVGSDQYKKLESSISDVSVKLAIAKDRTEDLTDALKLNVGSGVERANNSLRLLADGVKNLDFQKITTSIKGLGGVIKDSFVGPLKSITTGFGDIGKSTKSLDLGGLKSGLGGVTSGFGALGKAIISTGIGALVVGITSLIANFDELKNSGGLVGKVFTAIGDTIQFLVDKARPLLSFLGLVGTEADVKAEKIAEANDKEKEAITQRYDREIELAKAAGKETFQLQRDKLKAVQDTSDAEIALLQKIKEEQGKLNSDQTKRLKELTDAASESAFQLQLIDAEAAKSKEDKDKEAADKAKEIRKKRLEDEKKYRDTIASLDEKYNQTQVQQTETRFKKELDLIKGNSIEEKALRERITAQRDVELAKINERLLADQRKLNLELLTLQIQNDEAALLKTAETEEEKIQIQKNAEQELLELRLDNLEIEKNAAIEAVGVTAEQKKLIEAKYISDVNKLNEDSIKSRQDQIKKESDLVISAAQTQADAIKKERDAINSDSIQGVGLLGRLDLLDANLKKERQLLIDQREALVKIQQGIIDSDSSTVDEKKAAQDKIIELNKNYEDTLTSNAEQGAIDRANIVAAEIQSRAAEAQQLVNTISAVQSAALDSQQQNLDQESASIEQQYNIRKAAIEANIADEAQRTEALKQLDSDFQGARATITEKNKQLEAKRIKSEATAALASVLLQSAVGIGNAIAANKTAPDPITFGIGLAANIATVLLAIKKAKDAYKQANQAASAIGSSGGSAPSAPPPNTPSAPPNVVNPLIPNTNVSNGTNPVFNGTQFNDNQQTQTNPIVSVVEINRVQRSVRVAESSNTIQGG